MLKERFLALYACVFDKQGYVQPCGREACKELIMLANQIQKNTNFGDERTGMMNPQAMRDLHTKLTS